MKQPNATKATVPKVVEDCHELLAWIIPKLEQQSTEPAVGQL